MHRLVRPDPPEFPAVFAGDDELSSFCKLPDRDQLHRGRTERGSGRQRLSSLRADGLLLLPRFDDGVGGCGSKPVSTEGLDLRPSNDV